MCVLIYTNKRKVNEEEFKNCFNSNSDGFGMAWRKNDSVCFKKGIMELEEAWKFYNEHKFEMGHVLHFRKKSTGGKNKDLTHPFIVSKSSPLSLGGRTTKGVLFHNGTLRDWEDYKMAYMIGSGNTISDELSDTRLMAIIVARTGRDILEHLQGRFIVFEKDMSYIYGDFLKVDGVFFSNDSYKEKVKAVTQVVSKWDREKMKETKEELSWYDVKNYKI